MHFLTDRTFQPGDAGLVSKKSCVSYRYKSTLRSVQRPPKTLVDWCTTGCGVEKRGDIEHSTAEEIVRGLRVVVKNVQPQMHLKLGH